MSFDGQKELVCPPCLLCVFWCDICDPLMHEPTLKGIRFGSDDFCHICGNVKEVVVWLDEVRRKPELGPIVYEDKVACKSGGEPDLHWARDPEPPVSGG